MMNKLKPQLALPLLMAVLCLTACGGGGGDDTESVPPVVEPPIVIEPPAIPVESLVFATDSQLQIKPEFSNYFVDLRGNIGSLDDEPVRIAAVESLSNAPECTLLSINDSGFNLAAQKDAICDYRYRVELVENQQRGRIADETEFATATSRVIISSRLVDFSLTPISEVVADNTTVTINFNEVHGDAAHGVSNFTFILLGEGQVTDSQDAGTGAYAIKYTPKLKAYGVHRILYSWEKNTQIVVGYIDISVGAEVLPAISLKPITQMYNMGDKNIAETQIFKFPDEVLALKLSLQQVKSMGLVVAPTLGTNPSLLITAPKRAGIYYVSYVMQNAQGAQAIGLIKVVYQEDVFPDILVDRVLFLAPLRQQQADEANYLYSDIYTQTGSENYNPPYNVISPLYTWQQAYNVCLSRGARLPTVVELYALNNASLTGNVWPINGVDFWTYDSVAPNTHQVFDIYIGGSNPIETHSITQDDDMPNALICAFDTTPLNDSGVTWCSDGLNRIDCATTIETFPDQDARHGRDADFLAGTLTKKGSGRAGFDFTKIGSTGKPLTIQNQSWNNTGTEAAGTQWSCVLDNVTGLMWEVKNNNTASANYGRHTFTWYNPDFNTNGGVAGTQVGSVCNASGFCNTSAFKDAMNAKKMCGFDDWVIPNISEITSIVDYGSVPSIDTHFFPNAGLFWRVWSSNTAQFIRSQNGIDVTASYVIDMPLNTGNTDSSLKSGSRGLLLVRKHHF